MKLTVIRCDGTVEAHEIEPRVAIATIHRMLDAVWLDTVSLRDGRVMFINDLGHQEGRPDNARATAMYHEVCRPGVTHRIVGDVAVVVDADFEEV